MSAVLTKDQKRYLAQLGRSAFYRQRELALGRGEEWTHKEEAWAIVKRRDWTKDKINGTQDNEQI